MAKKNSSIMSNSETQQILAAITDQGLFERLATAVVRAKLPQYFLLAHTGVNSEGKTIRSPVDGIGFVPDVSPAHMIALHHTTCKREDIEKKMAAGPLYG